MVDVVAEPLPAPVDASDAGAPSAAVDVGELRLDRLTLMPLVPAQAETARHTTTTQVTDATVPIRAGRTTGRRRQRFSGRGERPGIARGY